MILQSSSCHKQGNRFELKKFILLSMNMGEGLRIKDGVVSHIKNIQNIQNQNRSL